MSVSQQRILQLSSFAGIGKILDEFRSGDAEGLEAILNGTIANGNGQVRFPSAFLPIKNQRASFGDKIRPQVGTEQRLAQGLLQTEVKLINGLQKRKVRFAGKALQAGLLAMRHLFRQQNRQEVAIAPVFALGSIRQLLVD